VIRQIARLGFLAPSGSSRTDKMCEEAPKAQHGTLPGRAASQGERRPFPRKKAKASAGQKNSIRPLKNEQGDVPRRLAQAVFTL
jgi:hypothetical protein